MQQTDESHAQELVAQDPSLRGLVGAIFRPGEEAAAKANADKSASQYATSQVQGLGHDITTKPGPHTGGHNYLAYQQDELHQMVNAGADPSGVNTQGESFNSLGNSLAEMTVDMDKTTSTASVSWQGKAAQGGAAFTTGMSSWHGSTAQGAQYAGTQMFEQSQALGQARTNMPPPMATPTTADVQNALLSYNPMDPSSLGTLQNLANQANASKANHQTMARVAQQYDSQLGTSATLPTFSTPSQFTPNPPASANGPGSGAGAGGSGSGSQAPSLHSGGGGSAGAPALRGNTSGSSGGYSASPPIPTGQGPVGQALGGQGSTTTQGVTGVYPPGGVGQQGGSPSQYPGGLAGSSGTIGGDVGGMAIGGMPIGGGFGPAGGGDTSYGGGSSGWGPSGSGGASSGGSGAGQAGARSAAGAAAAEESAVENGAAGARGSSGTAAGGMGAGRGGKGGEDRDHKRADYLLESDPESVFGSDEKTVPRVIGE